MTRDPLPLLGGIGAAVGLLHGLYREATLWRLRRYRRRWQARFDERILGSWRREQGLDNHDR